MISRRTGLWLLPLLLIGMVVGTIAAVPFSAPMGGFWADAQEFANTGHIRAEFTPCGYPALVGLGLLLGGVHGVIAVQALLYLSMIGLVYLILRLLEVERAYAIAGACLLGFHPDLLLNIKKIWDTNITTALLLAIFAALLLLMRRGLTPARATLAGVLWGLGMSVRPNFPLLALPIAFALCLAPVEGHRFKMVAVSSGLLLGGAALAFLAVTTAAHGRVYVPQNGPYNFYAGANPLTEHALLISLNAEPSIYPSLVAAGFRSDVNVYSPDLRSYYMQHGRLYLQQNLLRAGELTALKLATLLRPDTKVHPLATFAGQVKALLALAIPLWGIMLIWSRRRRWQAEDWLFVLFAVAYVVPFLLTNSDPRFRIPLDVLVLTHAVYRGLLYA